jgi:acyl dehydratase
MIGLYLRAALKRGALAEDQTIKRIEATLAPAQPEAEQLAAYRQVCGFVSSDRIPATWPHVLAAPLHLALLTHDDFPIRPLGIVHTRNRITMHRPMPLDQALGVRCWVEGHRQHRLGVEFDLETEVALDAQTVWSSTTTILARTRSGGGSERRSRQDPPPGEAGGRERSTVWHLPADQGRRYARVSGDYNPIHLYPWTAKALGFSRQIAHGMWSLARCVAEIEEELPETPWTVSVAFRKPVVLPTPVLFASGRDGETQTFSLRTRDARKVHLEGEIRSA